MALLKIGLCPSLTTDVMEKLTSKGIKRIQDFITMNPEKITSQCAVPYKVVMSIRRMLLAQYSSFPVNGLNLYEENLGMLAILPTGSQNIDNLLNIGIFTGEVTEVIGTAASGKTQFCMSFSLEVVSKLEQNVLYIDGCGGFSVERMINMLRKRFPDKKHVTSTLNRIRVSRCLSVHEMLDNLSQIRRNLIEGNDSFYNGLKVIIVDSVTALLLPYMFSVGYNEGRSVCSIVGKELNVLAKDYALAIITTNDMVSQEGTQTLKPALGEIWTRVASTRICFQSHVELCSFHFSDLEGTRTVTLTKSPRSQTNGKTMVKIISEGVK